MSGGAVRLILASASPRRRELLERLALPFDVSPTRVDETPLPDEPPPVHATRVARAKAAAAARDFPDRPVLAADTVVVLGKRILGKPADRAEAMAMLAELAGRAHLVVTAVVLRWHGREVARASIARVTFVSYDQELYEWYVTTGECDDKAGAYAVQGRGAILVDRVEGNVQAVVGLPLALLPRMFREIGLALQKRAGALELVPRGAG